MCHKGCMPVGTSGCTYLYILVHWAGGEGKFRELGSPLVCHRDSVPILELPRPLALRPWGRLLGILPPRGHRSQFLSRRGGVSSGWGGGGGCPEFLRGALDVVWTTNTVRHSMWARCFLSFFPSGTWGFRRAQRHSPSRHMEPTRIHPIGVWAFEEPARIGRLGVWGVRRAQTEGGGHA